VPRRPSTSPRRVRPLVAAAGALALAAGPAAAATGEPQGGTGVQGRFDRPQQGFAPPSTVLRDGTPEQVGLDPGSLQEGLATVAAASQDPDGAGPGRPLQAGAVALVVHHGVVVAEEASGYAVRYADLAGTELPPDQQVPTATDTVYDLASISKLFTTVVVLDLVEEGAIDLDAPVVDVVPEFAANGKEDVTARHLLTHTAGLPAWLPLWSAYPTPAERFAAALAATPTSEPGERYVYSDIGLISLGVLAERAGGAPLDQLVRERVTEPLGLHDTGYRPTGDLAARTAATEFQATPPRGMVRGEVHDENAWALGGVAGHAGVFSTARDVAVLGQMLLNGGAYDGVRILRQTTLREALTNQVDGITTSARGLGFELDARFYMGALVGEGTAGHTGFTGPSLTVDRLSRTVVVHLANRVHPDRAWGSNNASRRALADGVARSMRVPATTGGSAWTASTADATTSTLQVALDVPRRGAHLTYDLFLDTESTDVVVLETSTDGGATWVPVPLRARGPQAPGRVDDGTLAGSGHRAWWTVQARLAPGEQLLRWRYTTDAAYSGWGVRVDAVRAHAQGGGVLLHDDRSPEAFVADGWVAAP
jgi:CubicO group peptidase (beta-lactamase class C family)